MSGRCHRVRVPVSEDTGLLLLPQAAGHDVQACPVARGVEANGSISQHREEMQEDTAKAEAGNSAIMILLLLGQLTHG